MEGRINGCDILLKRFDYQSEVKFTVGESTVEMSIAELSAKNELYDQFYPTKLFRKEINL